VRCTAVEATSNDATVIEDIAIYATAVKAVVLSTAADYEAET
jgi:hypothetical protein